MEFMCTCMLTHRDFWKLNFIREYLVFCDFILTQYILFRPLQIRDYHRRNPSARFLGTTDDYEELSKEEPVIEFSGEVFSYAFLKKNFLCYFLWVSSLGSGTKFLLLSLFLIVWKFVNFFGYEKYNV
jgi:hypothetical protein